MMAEKVLILHEAEAERVLAALKLYISRNSWDLNDDEDAEVVVFLLDLKHKLAKYLDKGEGQDVREV
jgi:hypothetical protein